MTVTTTETDQGVRIDYTTDSGEASLVIIGLSKSEVDDRLEEFVSTHNLQDKAQR